MMGCMDVYPIVAHDLDMMRYISRLSFAQNNDFCTYNTGCYHLMAALRALQSLVPLFPTVSFSRKFRGR